MWRRTLGCGLAVLLVTACVGKDTTKPEQDLHSYDAVAGLDQARTFAGGAEAKLIQIRGDSVRSDGTIDAYAEYRPSIHYEFLRPAPQNEDLPVGAPGRGSGYETVRITVMKPGWTHVESNGNERDYRRLGMERDVRSASKSELDDVVDDPRCTFAKLWQVAAAEGVTTDAVADINYEMLHAVNPRPGYEFVIREIDVRIELDADCQIVKSMVPPAESP